MAIDTKSLTEVITEFRALQSKDAISPDSLGYILQRIVDLLSTAGTSETVSKITSLLDGFKAAGQAITAISQGEADSNHIYARKSTVNLATGELNSNSRIFIKEATTGRAGAMTAQQVLDLNDAKKNSEDLKTQVDNINKLISQLQEAIDVLNAQPFTNKTNISVIVENNAVRVMGFKQLVDEGCVPYIFRNIKKRNMYKHKNNPDAGGKIRYCSKRKGWNLWGSRHAVRVSIDKGIVEFSLNNKYELTNEALGFASVPSALIHVHTNKDGYKCVGWGRSIILLHDRHNNYKPRMVRLRLAIAFGKPRDHGRARISPDFMMSNLAEFSIVYNPFKDSWHFSR